MEIAVASDHAGFAYKELLKEHLMSAGHSVLDLGPDDESSCDYPDFAAAVARAVADEKAHRGIIICGTGIGVSMAANKVRGIRAAVCHDAFTARASRQHNDANVLTMGARVIGKETMFEIADIFLDTAFEGGRHADRIEKMMKIEEGS